MLYIEYIHMEYICVYSRVLSWLLTVSANDWSPLSKSPTRQPSSYPYPESVWSCLFYIENNWRILMPSHSQHSPASAHLFHINIQVLALSVRALPDWPHLRGYLCHPSHHSSHTVSFSVTELLLVHETSISI